jgi:hypothetical protein
MRSLLLFVSLLLPLQAQTAAVPQAKDWASFELGTIYSFCEMVKAGAKKFALGPPLKPALYERIREGSDEIAKKFGVKTFLEKDFLVTDLFPGEAANGEWVPFYYADNDVLEKYLALKKQKQQLVETGTYQGPARKEIARAFGRLLSYPEWKIDELLGEPKAANAAPRIVSQVTFLYFNELDKAAAFYANTVGLRLSFDGGWVRIFEISPTSSVGLVDATHGAHKPAAEKPVMVSMVMSTPAEVDRWYEQLKTRVQIPKPPSNSDKVAVRAFSFKDPEGHSLEVFAWLPK